jgi:shikimate kinase
MPTDAAPPADRRILLIGMMGSGKSTIGRALAARTGWPYHDNDDLLERAVGRTAREILGSDGEAAMRRAEADAVDAGLTEAPPAIVATAAGTVLDPQARDRIDGGGFVVWLHAAPDVLAERAAGGEHRPFLEDDPVGWFTRASHEREPAYREIADVTVDTGTTSVAEAVGAILEAASRQA